MTGLEFRDPALQLLYELAGPQQYRLLDFELVARHEAQPLKGTVEDSTDILFDILPKLRRHCGARRCR